MSYANREEEMGEKDDDQGKSPINQAAHRGVGGTGGRGSGQDRWWRRGEGPRGGIGSEEVDIGEGGDMGHERSKGGRGEASAANRRWRCVTKSATWLLALLPLCVSTGLLHRHSHRHHLSAKQQRIEHGGVLWRNLGEGVEFSAARSQWRWREKDAGVLPVFLGLRLRGGGSTGGMTEDTWEELNVANKRRKKKVLPCLDRLSP